MKNTIYTVAKIFLFIGILQLFGCSGNSNESFAIGGVGIGGSYARFIIVENFLYVVDNTSIQTFDISETANPIRVAQSDIGSRIESIFHLDGNLFIGSGLGLFLYQINDIGIPEKVSDIPHNFPIPPCDPVVANPTHAYVTLNTTTWRCQFCWGGVDRFNVLKVFDIDDLEEPQLIAEYLMSNPKGLGLDGNHLFLCDDEDGLRVLDVANPNEIVEIHHFTGFTAFDVIPLDGLLIVVGPDNVYQYDYSDIDNMVLISTIPIQV